MNYFITITTYFITGMMLTFSACGQNDRTILGYDYARSELNDALKNNQTKKILVDTLISNKETAINVSESILFNIYKKENIISQRPYEINFIDGYWVINGTLPKDRLGGTFLIIINSLNGEVIKLTHGK